MKRTEFLQETRKMRFEEAYEGCKSERLMHAEAALLHLGETLRELAEQKECQIM